MSLEDLRDKLSVIDRRIIDLVAERQSVAGEIGAWKRARGRATRDFAREKQVMEEARSRAAELGVPPGLAGAIMELLIRSSLTNQEQARVRADAHGAGRKALVVGGAGKMGRWFAEFLDSQGFDVTVADITGRATAFKQVTDWHNLPDDFSVTVLATPAAATARILEEMAAGGRMGLVFDIGSLKSPLIKALKAMAARGVRVTSLHPMFGPDTELLSGRHVLFMNVGVPEATSEAKLLFASTMAQQIQMELEEHDRLVAYVLGLSHALNIAFFTALVESGETAPRLAGFSSTTFDSQLAVAARVAEENPHLYFEIQAKNPFGLLPLQELQAAVQRIITVVRNGDEAAFVKLMERGRAYLASRR